MASCDRKNHLQKLQNTTSHQPQWILWMPSPVSYKKECGNTRDLKFIWEFLVPLCTLWHECANPEYHVTTENMTRINSLSLLVSLQLIQLLSPPEGFPSRYPVLWFVMSKYTFLECEMVNRDSHLDWIWNQLRDKLQWTYEEIFKKVYLKEDPFQMWATKKSGDKAVMHACLLVCLHDCLPACLPPATCLSSWMVVVSI